MQITKKKVLIVFGTRPEAIKLAPVITELRHRVDKFEVVVAVSGQHREILDQVLNLFDIQPDYDLNIMQPGQSLTQITVRVLQGVENVIDKEVPDIMLVQGDTTTAFASALVGFYHQIPIGHVEAGLRTHEKYNPFPEENNRQLISALAAIHFAPTQKAKENLLREGISPDTIYVTGNTVVDALMSIVQHNFEFKQPPLSTLEFDNRKVILVTAHRRENWGQPLDNVCLALKELLERYKDIDIVFPTHPNPKVRGAVEAILGGIKRAYLIEPLDYLPFVHLMSKVYLILTDSGGIQEEAPSLGKPVLVLRETTERPEVIEAGVAKLVGTDKDLIISKVTMLLENQNIYQKMTQAVHLYGDGRATQKIVEILV